MPPAYHARMTSQHAGPADEAAALRREGERAEQATLWREAADAYERCLSLASPGEDEAALLTGAGRCYWNMSEARTAWRMLRRAITLYQQRGDALGQARATLEIQRIWGPPERHREMGQAALDALGDSDMHLRSLLLARMARYMAADEWRQAFDRAMTLGREHGFEDVIAISREREAWVAGDEGRSEDAIAAFLEIHDVYARLNIYDAAANAVRSAGYSALEFGAIDRGYDLARRAFEYARGVHLDFSTQLAQMDMAAVHFARGDFDGCQATLDLVPQATDFRGDLYRLWMAERRGEGEAALRYLPDPSRGGNTPTAMGQIHAAAAAAFHHAGRIDAARQALRAWAEVDRRTVDDYGEEAAVLVDCLPALADDDLLRRVHAGFHNDENPRARLAKFTPLQGRAIAPVRAAVAHRLALTEEARAVAREGLAWCEREGLSHDATICARFVG